MAVIKPINGRRLRCFFRQIEVESTGCWRWTGARTSSGYGGFLGVPAHRVAYAWFVRGIPTGYHIDHLCRRKLCVNPAHCEPVTRAENSRRASRVVIGTCRKGHVLTEVGTFRNGTRLSCLRCRHIRREQRRLDAELDQLLEFIA